MADPQNPGFYVAAVDEFHDRGDRWHSGLTTYTGFVTVLPPNGPSCMESSNNDGDVLASAGSYHAGGVQGVLADGSVRFFADTIDTGNTAAASVLSGKSPYGVWGALGTRDGGETETEF